MIEENFLNFLMVHHFSFASKMGLCCSPLSDNWPCSRTDFRPHHLGDIVIGSGKRGFRRTKFIVSTS